MVARLKIQEAIVLSNKAVIAAWFKPQSREGVGWSRLTFYVLPLTVFNASPPLRKEYIVKEERMKVLEMIQDGKITAEDAMKLLEALGDTPEEPRGETEGEGFKPSRTRQRRRNESRQRQRRRRRGGADIQVEVQKRIREGHAESQTRGARSHALNSRCGRDRSGSDAKKTASEAISQWAEDGG